MSKGKLHQLLAVEPEIKSGEEKVRKETIKTFTGKQGHYDGLIRKYTPNGENEKESVEEEKIVVDTVTDKLEYTQTSIIRLLDFNLQKELANTKAKADIIVEDNEGKETTIATDLPATVLLNLESRLKDIRSIYNAIPTCDPSTTLIKDVNNKNRYISKTPDVRVRTKKTPRVIVKYQATKEFAAQTDLIYEDLPCGTIETTQYSGRLTPAEKSQLLGRIDELIRGVKTARQKANDVEVDKEKIGKKLFNYIHG